ncbi:MAG: lipocalin family protein [Bacteroidetes bacterium]|nr:lipocalin family protein [Bacteroidota bacterium]
MKKILAIAVILFSALTIHAQTANDLIGKWKLVNWNMSGNDMNIHDFFKTDEVYQVFNEDNSFESIVGDIINKGTWNLSGDGKTLTIKVEGQKKAIFNVDHLDANKRIISEQKLGTLTYQKQ